jgi:RimJ/RimL family protein N-acetyltransferase
MRPITNLHLQDSYVVEKMTDWRNKYRNFFLTQFNATPERTKKWLEKVVLSNPSQLLFLIYYGETLMGQYGFKDLNSVPAFLYNLIRGERGSHPKLMKYSVSASIEWLFDVMQINVVYGYTFVNNAMALKLNREVGFSCTEKLPLRKQIEGDEIRWVVGKAGELSPDNYYYQKLVMRRDSIAI